MRYFAILIVPLVVTACTGGGSGIADPDGLSAPGPAICDAPLCGSSIRALTAGEPSQRTMRRVPIAEVRAEVQAAFDARTPEAALLHDLAVGRPHPAVPQPLTPAARAWLAEALDRAAPGWRDERALAAPEPVEDAISQAPFSLETSGCGEMALQLRLDAVTVIQREDNFTKDRVYCVIRAQDHEQLELLHTEISPPLDAGERYDFEDSIYYGREAPRDPGDRLEVKYDCWEQDDPSEYEAIREQLEEVASIARKVAKGLGRGDFYALIVQAEKVGDLILRIAAVFDSSDHLYTADETFDRRALWGLIVERDRRLVDGGNNNGSDWSWQLHLTADGCAGEPATAPPSGDPRPGAPSCAQSCDGCCAGNTCKPGDSNNACGIGGGACKTCEVLTGCQRGACRFDPEARFTVSARNATIFGDNWDAFGNAPDPYLQIQVDGQSRVTNNVQNTNTPTWNADVVSNVPARALMEFVSVTVFDDDVALDDTIGQCVLAFSEKALRDGVATFICGEAQVTLGFRAR